MSHVSYLEAKRRLDDRALNRTVLAAFVDALPEDPTILEVGSGTATMPERLLEWGVIESGRWIAVDSHADAIEAGRSRLAGRSDVSVDGDSVTLGGVKIEFAVADAFEYAAGLDSRVDAVVGSAFFDIVDADRAVSALGSVTDLVYAPITYDGETAFEPGDDDDDDVLSWYHEHMRTHRPGGPDGGHRLGEALSTVIAAGPSPWKITPPYRDGETVVTGHVLETIERSVGEVGGDATAWATRRRQQLEAERLCYRAANVDLVGTIERGDSS